MARSTARRVASTPNGTTSIGSGKGAERLHQLGFVGDHQHPFRRRSGDDLLAQQRAAAALDQAELRVDLVGAVDIEVELGLVVECHQRDAELARELGGPLRGGHADDLEAAADLLGKQADEMLGRAPAAEPELHARLDLSHRRLGRPQAKAVVARDFVVVHRSSPPISMYLTSTNSSTP